MKKRKYNPTQKEIKQFKDELLDHKNYDSISQRSLHIKNNSAKNILSNQPKLTHDFNLKL